MSRQCLPIADKVGNCTSTTANLSRCQEYVDDRRHDTAYERRPEEQYARIFSHLARFYRLSYC
eukprot:scaffold3240_cov197-Alexandrium_tamarense.AAC.13